MLHRMVLLTLAYGCILIAGYVVCPTQILLLRVLIKVCCVSVRVTLHVCVFVLQSEQLMCRMLICLYVYFSVSIVLIKFNLMCF